MKITILTYGSRGDVQPFLAFAVGLRNAGHSVTLAAPHRFAEWIEQYAIRCEPLAGDPDELSLLFNEAGSNPIRMVRGMQTHVYRIASDVVKSARKALQGADMLVHSFAFTTGAHSYARELRIPDVSIQMFPVFAPTRAFPAIGMPPGKLGWLNRLGHWLSTQVFWHAGNMGYHRLRRGAEADFPARLFWPFSQTVDRPPTPLIFAISPVVIPKPTEWNQPHIHMPGYFFLDTPDYQPPDVLRCFLEEGDPPVCITFGSMVNRDAERIGRATLDAVQRAGMRAVWLTGWSGWQPPAPSASILLLDSAPHDWLFPRCQAVIHHGGAGTTAAGLRAGVSSILVPHIADQFLWGSRVAAIGAGPEPLSLSQLSAEKLDAALRQSQSTVIRRRAAQMGALIRSEDGVGRAVSLVEQHAEWFKRT